MKNWKTTVVGLLGAAVQIALPLIQGGLGVKEIVTAVVIGLLGILAKDAGVTGSAK